jgi:antitoxin (DNA-binding transcriptional repressor) of toxin-antitoxin stability system
VTGFRSLSGRCRPGAEVVIADHGEPVARLVPADHVPATNVGHAAAILDWLARHPLPPEAFRSAEEIDDAIGAERSMWD